MTDISWMYTNQVLCWRSARSDVRPYPVLYKPTSSDKNDSELKESDRLRSTISACHGAPPRNKESRRNRISLPAVANPVPGKEKTKEAPAPTPHPIKRLPWVDRSDEEDSPLAPMNGDESLLSSQSLEADLSFVGADDVPLADEDLAADDQELDFILFPTDSDSLPYFLRLSDEYDARPRTGSVALVLSSFSPLPRSPLREAILPFDRRGVARIVTECQPVQAIIDVAAQLAVSATSPLDVSPPRPDTPVLI
ncbi:hypothetical protein FB107DRAFT_280761 [Schizophyllum commune]